MTTEIYYETTIDRQYRVRIKRNWVLEDWKAGQPMAFAPIFYRRRMVMPEHLTKGVWHLGPLGQDYSSWAIPLDKVRKESDDGKIVAIHLVDAVYHEGIVLQDSKDEYWRVKIPAEIYSLAAFPSRNEQVHVLRDDPDVSLWSPAAYNSRHSIFANTWINQT